MFLPSGLKLPFFFLITLAKGDEWLLVDGTCVAVGAMDSFAIRLVVAGTILSKFPCNI